MFKTLEFEDDRACHFCDQPAYAELIDTLCNGCGKPLVMCKLHAKMYKDEPEETKQRIKAGLANHMTDLEVHVMDTSGGAAREVHDPEQMPERVREVVEALDVIRNMRKQGQHALANVLLDVLKRKANANGMRMEIDTVPDNDVTGMTKQ